MQEAGNPSAPPIESWFLTIEAVGPDGEPPVDLALLPQLIPELEAYDATVNGGRTQYGAILRLLGNDLGTGLDAGLLAFAAARLRVGLPPWPIVHMEMITWSEALRRSRAPKPRLGITLLGSQEVQVALGISRQRFAQLQKQLNFPQSIQLLRATPIWRESDIDRYAQSRHTTPLTFPPSWTPFPHLS